MILAAKTFHRYRAVFFEDANWADIRNVWCAIELALEVRKTADYFWLIEDEKAISGPLDDLWPLLEYLSKVALKSHSVDDKEPVLTFDELLIFWDVKKVENGEVCNPIDETS